MKLNLFLATVTLLSSTWSFVAKADRTVAINKDLVAGIATLNDTSDMASFFKKYGKNINNEVVTWYVENERTSTGDTSTLIFFILCSEALNQNKQCASPQLIVEVQTSSVRGLLQSRAKLVDSEGFVYIPAGAGATHEFGKPFPPYANINRSDMTFLSSLVKLRLKNDPAITNFYKKENIRPRLNLPSIKETKINSEVVYEISQEYTSTDFYGKYPCGSDALRFSLESAAEYIDFPQDASSCPFGYIGISQ